MRTTAPVLHLPPPPVVLALPWYGYGAPARSSDEELLPSAKTTMAPAADAPDCATDASDSDAVPNIDADPDHEVACRRGRTRRKRQVNSAFKLRHNKHIAAAEPAQYVPTAE